MIVGANIENIIKVLYKVRPPFNITTLSLLAGIKASKDEEFVQKSVALNQEQMAKYIEFAKKNDIEYIQSFTNFITYLFDNNKNSTKIADSLMKKGIIIRDLASYGLNAVRITVGTAEQNNRLFEVLSKEL